MSLASSLPLLILTAQVASSLSPGSGRASEAEISDDRPLRPRPGDFSLLVETGVAFPLSSPQSDLFKTGGGQTVKALWVVSEQMNAGPTATFLTLPTEAPHGEAGVAWAFGASVRFRLFRNSPQKLLGMSPWIDADALYIGTGGLRRTGIAAAAGWSIPIGRARAFWFGPFARYLHIMQADRPGFDGRDAKVLSFGLGLEVGLGTPRERGVVAAQVHAIDLVTTGCPDRDQDNVPDAVDRCPDAPGTLDDWGCPRYEKLVVKRDKIELKEKLQFAWNDAALQESSFSVLDQVVQAMTDDRGFRVQIEGHASSEGTDDHNQALSEQRADAVLNYLVSHGVDRDRLASKGLGASAPRDTNNTSAGREHNRRVEFVVYFLIFDPERR